MRIEFVLQTNNLQINVTPYYKRWKDCTVGRTVYSTNKFYLLHKMIQYYAFSSSFQFNL